MNDFEPKGPDAAAKAAAHYQRGLDLKSRGHKDPALTEFRRAVLSDPGHAAAHYEIGLLCRDKAREEKLFARHAFDSFRRAAQLDPKHVPSHEQYVTMAHQLGLLDQILSEYEELSRREPDNEIYKAQRKNIFAISMAMATQNVNIAGGSLKPVKKIAVIGSIGLILLAAGLMLAPLLMRKFGASVDPGQMKQFFRLGVISGALGLGGILAATRID